MGIAFSVIQLTRANPDKPNPGHSWDELDVAGDAIARSVTITGGTTLPACDFSKRGKQFLLQSLTGAGLPDGFYICKKKADDNYGWIALGSPKLFTAATFNNPNPYGVLDHSWKTFGSFTIPADAKNWACSYGKKTLFWGVDPYLCGEILSQIVCDGSIVYSDGVSGVGDDFHLSRTPIFTMGVDSANCVLQLKEGCDSSPLVKAAIFLHGTCYYVKPE